ncbi:hypothetical protein AKJ38_01400 [candidate division MSBL1 archaeon SCGC-AAA259I14]|uniref:Cardiolipin synthase N-terminal domain-containing protein n=1 Tax=candidate division MSBL1 archaeon SCGC-AAA259I14 TaxID=1698268 RepID=A0A133USX6_9EURY|nr:hypothetical protein AKJ38_01400 [candidate division MSBL1 archaeon SCGC-AAA259I14]
MLEYVGLIIQLVLFVLVLLWIRQDVQEKEMETKIYWIWTLAAFAGLLFLGIPGLAIVTLSYYFWSRHIR